MVTPPCGDIRFAAFYGFPLIADERRVKFHSAFRWAHLWWNVEVSRRGNQPLLMSRHGGTALEGAFTRTLPYEKTLLRLLRKRKGSIITL